MSHLDLSSTSVTIISHNEFFDNGQLPIKSWCVVFMNYDNVTFLESPAPGQPVTDLPLCSTAWSEPATLTNDKTISSEI